MTPLTETNIQRQILDYLARVGVMAWRNNTGRRGGVQFGAKGSPDILGVLPGGRALGIEVKKPGEKATPDQLAWGKRMLGMGGAWCVAVSLEAAQYCVISAIADTQAAMTAEEA